MWRKGNFKGCDGTGRKKVLDQQIGCSGVLGVAPLCVIPVNNVKTGCLMSGACACWEHFFSGKTLSLLTLLELPDDAAWISNRNYVGGYVFDHYASGADRRVLPDRYPWADDRPATNPDVVTDRRWSGESVVRLY